MLGFRNYLVEEAEGAKLKHLTHVEDRLIHPTEEGYHHAMNALKQTHDHITKGSSDSILTTKYDGSPSVVFGHHPETGKFFVASKSAFNKNPKINYSEEDIEKNHGHAPGLVEKLKEALRHLPKVAPKKGVYQGDFMYGHGDVEEKKDKYQFTPNTITYAVPKKSPEGKKISKASIGVVVHTKYHGTTLQNMHAGFEPDTHNFKNHEDVHIINHHVDTSKIHHSPEAESQYQEHLLAAHNEFKKAPHDTFATIHPHEEHLNTYFNKTVLHGEKPSPEGYKQHLRERYGKEIEKLKTQKSRSERISVMDSHLNHVDQNKKQFNSFFKMHHHIQQAKNALVSTLATNPTYEHKIGTMKTGPEGNVVTYRGMPSKLVNREEFSRQNFLKSKNR